MFYEQGNTFKDNFFFKSPYSYTMLKIKMKIVDGYNVGKLTELGGAKFGG